MRVNDLSFSASTVGFRTSRGLLRAAAVCVVATLFATSATQAAVTYTWDSSGTSSAAPVDTGGSWNTTSTNWSTGSGPDVVWPNTATNVANFGSATSTGSGGLVTVDSAITAGGININKAGYTFGGAGSLTIGSGTFVITSNYNTTIATALSGSNNVSFNGTGTYTLTGASTVSGLVQINAGATVSVDSIGYANSATSGELGNGSVNGVRIYGGTLTYTGGTVTVAHGIKLYSGGTTSTFDNEGTGVMTLNGFGVGNDAGNRTLTLTGSAAGGGILGQALVNSTNATPGIVSLIKAGADTWTLNVASTYSGTTTISGGTLKLTSTIANTSLVNLTGGTLDVSGQAAFTLGSAQALQGAGSFKGATGATTLNGAIQIGSTNASTSGTASTLAFTGGSTVLGSTSATSMDLFTAVDSGVGTSDKLTAAQLSYGGTLTINNETAQSLTAGESWTLFGGTQVGSTQFAAINYPTLDSGLAFNLNYSTGVLSVVSVPEPASLGLLTLVAGGLMTPRRKSAVI